MPQELRERAATTPETRSRWILRSRAADGRSRYHVRTKNDLLPGGRVARLMKSGLPDIKHVYFDIEPLESSRFVNVTIRVKSRRIDEGRKALLTKPPNPPCQDFWRARKKGGGKRTPRRRASDLRSKTDSPPPHHIAYLVAFFPVEPCITPGPLKLCIEARTHRPTLTMFFLKPSSRPGLRKTIIASRLDR